MICHNNRKNARNSGRGGKQTEEKILLLPRQALYETGAEVIEGNSNFHVLVYCVLWVRAQ